MHNLNTIRLVFVLFAVFVGSVIYAADTGIGKPYLDVVRSLPLGDKASHFALMGTLSALANLAFDWRVSSRSRFAPGVGTMVVTLAVVAEEISQIWIPVRTFDVYDLAADFLGIACGALAARMFLFARSKDALKHPA